MKTYLQPTITQGNEFFTKLKGKGSFVMLNLIRFNDKALYTEEKEIEKTGKEAYDLYLNKISSGLVAIGSEILFKGKPNRFLIGPIDEQWDFLVLVKHQSVACFLAFSQSKVYLENIKHQTASIKDFRLLPMT